MILSVRGAGGLNLAMHSAEFDPRNPQEASFLYSCRNVDISLARASMPRLGLLRATSWPGLLYDEATGSLFTGIASLTGPIVVMFPDPSNYAAKPGVGT